MKRIRRGIYGYDTFSGYGQDDFPFLDGFAFKFIPNTSHRCHYFNSRIGTGHFARSNELWFEGKKKENLVQET